MASPSWCKTHLVLTYVISGSLFGFYILIVGKLKKLRDKFNEDLALEALKPDKPLSSTWRVHNLLTANELKFESFISMSARGLLMTYAIPSISSVLVKTGGFSRDISRRYAGS